MNKIKKLDLQKNSFIANNVNYTILEEIPLSRYRAFKKLSIKLLYGQDIETLIKNCIKAYNYLNQPKPEPLSAGMIIHNIATGLKDLEDESREDAALLICALIIVRDDENIGVYDEKLCREKIRDWELEGFGTNDFFELALTSLTSFKKVFMLFTTLMEAAA